MTKLFLLTSSSETICSIAETIMLSFIFPKYIYLKVTGIAQKDFEFTNFQHFNTDTARIPLLY